MICSCDVLRRAVLTALLLLAPIMGGCDAAPEETSAPVHTPRVVARYPHAVDAYTQGLVYHEGFLYESTGQYRRSSLRKVSLTSGQVLMKRSLDGGIFAEGLALWNDKLIQLTWENRVGFVYTLEDFKLVSEFDYEGEGWGLTHDGKHLIMSDGTATLRFLDPETFQETHHIRVRDVRGKGVPRLNELEYIHGRIYANVWQTDRIAIIHPETGVVEAWIDLAGLLADHERLRADVLNGIAWDQTGQRLFVTGKLWPWVFEIEAIPAPDRE